MSKTVEELLKQRFKLENCYPGSPNANEIFYQDDVQPWLAYDEDRCDCFEIELLKKYPYLFKKLEWWEERGEDELPKYLKDDNNWSKPFVVKVKSYYGENFYVEFENCKAVPDQCDPNQYCTEWFLPATEKEFKEYESRTQYMKKEIIEGNKLIAEFFYNCPTDTDTFGREVIWIAIEGKHHSSWVKISDLKYHTSWDWLMPVVQKIISLKDFDTTDGKIFNRNPYYAQRLSDLKDMLSLCHLETLWLAVVEFIKWYNTQAPIRG